MDTLMHRLFLHQWPQKLLSLLLAVLVWLFINSSITETKTIPFVPIRIVNLPADKTILGLQPNGYLDKRITLTVTGTKDVIEAIEPGDLEVLLDASDAPNEWIVQITKKNLVSLNPEIDLHHHIDSVSHPEFVIKLSKFITEAVPLLILPPKGSSPNGYQYVGIWPRHLSQTVSGPEEQVLSLKNSGLEISFDLSEITKDQLDTLHTSQIPLLDDEISFLLPEKWKKITIPFSTSGQESMNDPNAKYLQIDFLRKNLHPLPELLPLRLFFSTKILSSSFNPQTLTFGSTPLTEERQGLFFLNKQLFLQNVSKLFVQIIKEYLTIDVVAEPKSESEILNWSLDLVDLANLENAFVQYYLEHEPLLQKRNLSGKLREPELRDRFREYTENLSLWINKDQTFLLFPRLENGFVVFQEKEMGE